MNVKASLSRRLREIRQELFGEHGGPELARRLGLPARTWYNYETGVTVPAEVLLGFIDQTGASPSWLLSGGGSKFHRAHDDAVLSDLSPIELIRRGLEKLEQEGHDISAIEGPPADLGSDFVAVHLVSLADLATPAREPLPVNGYVMAYRQWLPNPEQTVAVRLEDDAMHPILPMGSVVAIDRSLTDPRQLQGRIVAARLDGTPVIRWLDLSGRHLIFRPNQPSREHPLVPIELEPHGKDVIIGQVVWSWSRFSDS